MCWEEKRKFQKLFACSLLSENIYLFERKNDRNEETEIFYPWFTPQTPAMSARPVISQEPMLPTRVTGTHGLGSSSAQTFAGSWLRSKEQKGHK